MKDLERKETDYIRLKRHKISVDDFDLLTVIGRGAFGEVWIWLYTFLEVCFYISLYLNIPFSACNNLKSNALQIVLFSIYNEVFVLNESLKGIILSFFWLNSQSMLLKGCGYIECGCLQRCNFFSKSVVFHHSSYTHCHCYWFNNSQ